MLATDTTNIIELIDSIKIHNLFYSCRAKELPFWFGLIFPFLVIFTFNWVMFAMIMVSLCKHSTVGKGSNVKHVVNSIKKQLIIAIGLATLFGLGWGFGLATSSTPVKELTCALQIIFSIFVGFQGLLFFVLHGLRSPVVRGQWKSWVSSSARQTSKVYSKTRTGSIYTLSKSHDNTSKAEATYAHGVAEIKLSNTELSKSAAGIMSVNSDDADNTG